MKMSSGGKLAVLFSLLSIIVVAEAQQVPCHFIFGDSVVDNGNNNAVPVTDAKANFPPYGIDLPNVTRGRFTNGLTPADMIGELLGLDTLIPSFLTARGNATLSQRGVNYASGGAGIRDETGNRRGVTSLRSQVINHLTTTVNLATILGIRTPSYLNQCLYSVYIGANDYLNNYFKPSQYPTSRIYTPEQYARVLIRQYSDQLQTLYRLGARKIALNGIGLIGCIPLVLNGTSCLDQVNNASALFNTMLQELVTDLNRRLPNARFTFINGRANTTASALPNYGPCCEVASGQELCVPSGNVCADRDQYIFWDNVHPTEATYLAAATVAYNARSPSDASPFDINTLAQM